MSEFTTKKITDRAGTGAPNFTYGVNIGGSDSGLIGKAYTASGTEPSSPANGDTWYDSTNDKYYLYVNGEFKQITHVNEISVIAWGGDRGIMAHGFDASAWLNSIDKFDILNSANATDFGDLTVARAPCPVGSSSRCLFGGGMSPRTNVIDYITPSTPSNATDFGDLSQDKSALSSATNGIRGLWFGGYVQGASPTYNNNVIEYVTIANTGNAVDFGDTTAGSTNGAGLSNDTYGLLAGGYGRISGTSTYKQSIDKVTIATAGNATDYGDLTKAKSTLNGASDNTRGLIGGGYDPNLSGGARTNEIEYVTIATDGNGTDFGDLTVARSCSASSNVTYAVFVAGESETALTNILDRVTIQTLGNAADHGDLTTTSGRNGAWSGNAA